MIQVAAALIRKEEKFMICRRPPHKARGLLWEFVGGKLEIGETLEEALKRECREELDVSVLVGDIFFKTEHIYPDISICLTVFNASIENGEPKMLEHCDIKWISPDEIDKYDFCPADETVLNRIKKEYEEKGEKW